MRGARRYLSVQLVSAIPSLIVGSRDPEFIRPVEPLLESFDKFVAVLERVVHYKPKRLLKQLRLYLFLCVSRLAESEVASPAFKGSGLIDEIFP